MVLTGGKSAAELERAFKDMYPVLCSFKKASVLTRSAPQQGASDQPARKKQKT